MKFNMNFFKHLKTITRHRHRVIHNCYLAGIGFQGLFHDLSKYMPSEFIAGVTHYQGTRSPNEGEREDYGYSLAWMHHKGRNRHHFEYWTDYDHVTRKISPVMMPKRFVVEMLCDRIAASQIYLSDKYNDGEPLAYFIKGSKTRVIHKRTSAEIELLLRILALEGQTEVFAYTKKWLARRSHSLPALSEKELKNPEIARLAESFKRLPRTGMASLSENAANDNANVSC